MKILKVRNRWIRITGITFSVIFILALLSYVLLLINKKEILFAITSSFNKNINGKLEVEDIDFGIFANFPSISVRLKNILLTDSLNGKSDTILIAKELLVALPVKNLWSKQKSLQSVRLENAKISLLKSDSGGLNLQIISSDESKKNDHDAPLPRRIRLHNVSFSYANSDKEKSFRLRFINSVIELNRNDSAVAFRMKGGVHFDHLIFNPEKGGYLTNKTTDLNLEGEFIDKQKLLAITGGTAIVDKQVVAIQSRFVFGKEPTMQFNFFSRSIKPDAGYSILPKSIEQKLVRYQVYKPITVYAIIRGSLAPNTKPYVDLYVKTSGNRISLGSKSFDDLTFKGWFTNHVDSTKINDDHNSRFIFPVFDGAIYQIPMHTQLVITDLKSPVLLMKASSDLDKASVSKVVDTSRIKILSGNIKVRFSYSGPMVNYFDSLTNKMNAHINGSMIIDKVELDYLPRDFEFRDVSGSVIFNDSDLHVNSVSFKLNDNSAYVNGSFVQFIPSLFSNTASAKGDFSLTAATIDLNSFNFQNDTISFPKKNPPTKAETTNRVASALDMMIDRFELNFSLHADTVLYKHFAATGVQSELIYASDYVHFKNTEMKASGGTFSFAGDITKMAGLNHEVKLQATINNADISSFLKGFDNFGQTTITHNDVDGKLKADISFHCRLNNDFKVIPSSMRGKMKVSIKDGELKNFESIEQISKYVFKNRDFRNIRFSGVENEYELNGSEITFSHLDLYSSVLTLFAEGKYDFNKTNTLLLIHIPLGNIRKGKTEELAENPDSNRKSGIGLTLKAYYGEDNKLHMAPVIFGKKKVREEIASKGGKKKEEVIEAPRENKTKLK